MTTKENIKVFGLFQGLPYGDCDELFADYQAYKNGIPKERVLNHIMSLEPAYACVETRDIFTGEKLKAGLCTDDCFRFPIDFLHYYKNYDIGIPYEYEEYLKTIL